MKNALIASLVWAAAVAALSAAPLTPEQTLDRRSIGDLEFSPDGSRLVFTVTDPPKASSRARALWMLDVETKALKQLTSGRWQIRQIEWLPGAAAPKGPRDVWNDRLVAIATSRPEIDQWTDHLYTINLDNVARGDFNEIAAPRGPLGGLAVSPDGKTLAYVGARVDGPEVHDLYLQPVAGGSPQNVTAATIDRPGGIGRASGRERGWISVVAVAL